MKIINLTRNTTLADNIIIADTLLKRIKGLLGRKEFKKNEALVIRPCNSIHTFFMRFPIDVLFVNSENKIIVLKSYLKPWRVTPVYRQAKFVVELPVGLISESRTELADELTFI